MILGLAIIGLMLLVYVMAGFGKIMIETKHSKAFLLFGTWVILILVAMVIG